MLSFFQQPVRISPVYYVLTLITFTIALYAPVSTEIKPDISQLIHSVLYIPIYKLGPVVSVGWTLNFEMFFYLVYGLILFLPARLQLPGIIAWLIVSMLCGYFYEGENPLLQQITNPLLVEFGLGVMIGRLFTHDKLLGKIPAVVVLVLCVAYLLFSETLHLDRTYRVWFYALPCAGVVAALLALEAHNVSKFDSKILLLAGEISYSLYLVHILSIAAFGKLVTKFSLFNFANGYLLYFCDFLMAFFLGLLVYKLIESPAHKLSKQLIK